MGLVINYGESWDALKNNGNLCSKSCEFILGIDVGVLTTFVRFRGSDGGPNTRVLIILEAPDGDPNTRLLINLELSRWGSKHTTFGHLEAPSTRLLAILEAPDGGQSTRLLVILEDPDGGPSTRLLAKLDMKHRKS
jgi:hypothetical protein